MQMMPLEKLVLNWDLYPRRNVDATQVRRMVAALHAGEDLPPILVDRQRLWVVDGFHRHAAYTRAKASEAPVELKSYRDEAAMLLEAVALNARHGVPLEPMDQVRSYLLAQDLGIEPARIAQALAVPAEHLGEIMQSRIATGPDGLPLIVKRTISRTHAGRHLSKAQAAVNERLVGMRVEYYLARTTELIRHRLLDLTDPHIVDLLRDLKAALDTLDEKGALAGNAAVA